MAETVPVRYYILKLPVNNPAWCREPGDTFDRKDKDYVPVWTDIIEYMDGEELEFELEELFRKFNMQHPEHYAAPSLSVGDIIMLQWVLDDRREFYACCGCGWKEMKECFTE